MRILLVLTCCFGLASFAGAAQPDDQNQNQGKKKGGGNAPAQQQAVTPQTGKKYKAGPGGGPHGQNFQQQSTVHYKGTGKNAKNWQGPVTGGTQTNVSGNASGNGNAATTKFGKKYSGQANATGGTGAQKFQKQHFNLQSAKAFLVMILPLTVLGLILPNYTRATPGPTLSTFQMVFLSQMSVGIYAVFLFVQNWRPTPEYWKLVWLSLNTTHAVFAEDDPPPAIVGCTVPRLVEGT